MTEIDSKADAERRRYTEKLSWDELPDNVQQFWRERAQANKYFAREVEASKRVDLGVRYRG